MSSPPPDWLTASHLSRVADQVEGSVVHTPMLFSSALSELTGARVYLKAENLQQTGSFKLRGATYKVGNLARHGTRGVVAASAGNHARAVAHAARAFGVACTVLMPMWASPQKIRNTERLGATVVLHGQDLEACASEAHRRAADEGLELVHPFDDWEVIAGQATLGREVLQDRPTTASIVVPIGGGGLAAGVLAASQALGSTPRVVGVRPTPEATLPDGIRVKHPGGRPLQLLKHLADQVTVDDRAVARAMTFLLEAHALLAEGAGAASVAAVMDGLVRLEPGEEVVAIVSGGNVDLSLLEKAVDFGLAASGRLGQIRLRMADRPGELGERLSTIGRLGGNVRTVEHERGEVGLAPGITEALVTVETRGPDHLAQIRFVLTGA